MTFIRDLISDLVTKRLWPVAALLVAALIAVPVVVSKPAPEDQQAAAEAQNTAARAAKESAAAQPVVSLADVTTKSNVKGLHAKDPFRRKAASAKATDAVTVTPGAGGSNDTGSSGGSGGTGDTGGTGGTPPAATPRVYTTYDVDLRFGQAGKQKTHRNIARLTALPNASDPVVVYMGMMSDGKTAVFLVNADATAQGDATCKPKKSECTYVYLHERDTEFFDVGTGASLVQYELKILSIDARKTTSKAAAAKALARESVAGRKVLRASVSMLGYLRFSRHTGTLLFARPSATAGAHGRR